MSGQPAPPPLPPRPIQYDHEEMIAQGGKLTTDRDGKKIWEFHLYSDDENTSSDEDNSNKPVYYARRTPNSGEDLPQKKPPKQKTEQREIPDDFLDDALDFRFEIAYEKKVEGGEIEEIPETDREEEEKEAVTVESTSTATATGWVWKG